MIRRILSSAATLFILAISVPSHAEWKTPDYARISALLFPETKSWTLVSTMKAADEAYLLTNREKLNEAYSVSGIGKGMESAGACSLMERAFSTHYYFPEGFHVHDVDLDGRMDVIYANPNPCNEGFTTIMWFGTEKGFVIRQGALQNILALRVKEGNPLRMSSVSVGCCGDPIDVYSVGTVDEAPADGGKRVVDYAQLPSRYEIAVPFAAGDTGFVLRTSPLIDNVYDASAKEVLGFPVFGNILSKYLFGCTGEVVGRQVDTDSRLWYFVLLDQACDSLRTDEGFKVSAGWVEAAVVSLKK